MLLAREFLNPLIPQVSMPDVYHGIRALVADPDAQVSDFERIIRNDSILSLRIIGIANSHYFGFSRKVETLHQAISLIGVIQLHDLLLSTLCIRSLSQVPDNLFNLNSFWRYSISCGIAARSIAKRCGMAAPNRFFTLGLLHEVGHAALFIRAPDQAIEVLESQGDSSSCISLAERETLGFDYLELGQELMRVWHLPDVYQQIARYHLAPCGSKDQHRRAVDIVHLAHHLLGPESLVTYDDDSVTASALFTQYGLGDTRELQAQIEREIQEHLAEVLMILGPVSYD